MKLLEVSGALRPIYGSLGVKRLILQKPAMDRTEGCESVIRTAACLKLVVPVICGLPLLKEIFPSS